MSKNLCLDDLCSRIPVLSAVREQINEASGLIAGCYEKGGKLLICGNGGSSSDSDHMAAELMKSFENERPLDEIIKKRIVGVSSARGKYICDKLQSGLPAISLSAHTSLATAISNDIGSDMVFAQQVLVYGNEKDILFALSTSGNSGNVLNACITALAKGMKVIGLTGKDGGRMKELCSILINVPEGRTAMIQELHLPVIHTLCRITEDHFYGKSI